MFFSLRYTVALLGRSPIQNRTGELRNLLLFLMPAVFDAESLDLALTAFERQAQRERACFVRDKDIHQKEQAPQPKKQIQQQHQQLAVCGEGDANSETDKKCSEEQNMQVSSKAAAEEDVKRKSNTKENSFLSRAFKTLSGFRAFGESSLPADVTCFQRMLSPFILRRLKGEVMQELPKKTNIVLRCELEGSQKALYLKEIRQHESDLAVSLRRLTHAFAGHEDGSNGDIDGAGHDTETLSHAPLPPDSDSKPQGEFLLMSPWLCRVPFCTVEARFVIWPDRVESTLMSYLVLTRDWKQTVCQQFAFPPPPHLQPFSSNARPVHFRPEGRELFCFLRLFHDDCRFVNLGEAVYKQIFERTSFLRVNVSVLSRSAWPVTTRTMWTDSKEVRLRRSVQRLTSGATMKSIRQASERN